MTGVTASHNAGNMNLRSPQFLEKMSSLNQIIDLDLVMSLALTREPRGYASSTSASARFNHAPIANCLLDLKVQMPDLTERRQPMVVLPQQLIVPVLDDEQQ